MTEWGIDTLFNPGKRHMDEEKRRLQSTREEVGDASGGRRVDFGAGTVRISRSTAAEPAAGEQDEDERSEGEAADDSTLEDARSEGEVAGDETPRERALRRRLAAKPESDPADG